MYYTGLDPRTMQKVYVPKDPHEKAMQRALMQYALPQNRSLVEEALRIAHREDLIGFGPKCLIRPEKQAASGEGTVHGKNSSKSRGRKRTIRNIHKKHS